jgi:ATP-dependent RNA helicase DeaD
MAMICRRGDVTSRVVGAIRVQDDRATFEISQDAAGHFESRAKRPDQRDPDMRIDRAGAGSGGAGRKYGR